MSTSAEDAAAEPVVVFKKPSRPKGGGKIRKRALSPPPEAEDAAAGGSSVGTLEMMREMQRQRQRAKGVVLEAKGIGDEVDEALATAADDEPQGGLDSTFTSQADSGEVDQNMLKYIEEQMQGGGEKSAQPPKPALDAEEEALYKTPAHLLGHLAAPTFAAEESAQRWLAGINEVPLGTEAKMDAIEATECAKEKLAQQARAKEAARAAGASRPELPGNYNSNFHLHRRENSAASKEANKGKPAGAAARGSRLDKDTAGDAGSYARFQANVRNQNARR